jgi:hypothetical protein
LKYELSELDDPRDQSYIWHKLEDVILIALFAVMAGCDEYYKIPIFAAYHISWFEAF